MIQSRNALSQTALAEPLSPELALVDPELASRAREHLGSPGSTVLRRIRDPEAGAPRRESSAAPDLAQSMAPASEPDVRPPYESRRRPGQRSPRTLMAAAALTLAVVGGITAVQATSEGGRLGPGSAPTADTMTKDAGVKGAVHRANKGRRRGIAPNTRMLAWPEAQGASSYLVEIFTMGQRVFEASLEARRLDLPNRWTYRGRRFRLTPGTYQWRVRPVFGSSPPTLGEPIVRSSWIVR